MGKKLDGLRFVAFSPCGLMTLVVVRTLLEINRLIMESKNWTLSERELTNSVQTNRLTVSSRSPLAPTILGWVAGGSPLFPKNIEPDLWRAIDAVAQPRLEIGLLLSPPHGNDINWFYSGGKGQTDGLAGYRANGDNYQFVWTSEHELMAQIRSCLQLDIPTDGGGFSLDLSVSAYQTFLALVDCNRERALESLLKRSADSERYFTFNHVFETFMRNYRSDDWRWLAALARAISPFEFRLNEAECEKGLREIAERGLMEEHKEGWTLSPSMQLICATLGSPLAYCAMHRRRFVSPERSEKENLIALRCMGTLWLIQFAGLDSSDLRVRLKDASGEETELIISEKFHEWPPVSQSPVASTLSQTEQRPCPFCGKPLRAEVKFCPSCGKKFPTATTSPVQRLTNISPKVSPPSAQKLDAVSAQARQVETPALAARRCPNPKCGRTVATGKKFCTSCGIPVPEIEQSHSLESKSPMPQVTPRSGGVPSVTR